VTPEDTSPAGLQAGKQSQRYTYSVSERLLRISDGSSANNGQGAEIARYAYDPFGRRIKKTVSQTPSGQGSTGTTLYFYADEGLIAEVDGSPTTNGGNITTTYGWMPNNTWGTAPQWKRDHAEQSGATDVQGSANTNGITHYVHVDHLGTSQRLTNTQGETTWRAVSEAFGKTFVDTTLAPATTGTTTNNLRFPGQYEDQETATHYNYFRDYDPSTGRYVQSDPIGLAGGINTYGYVNANPLKLVDPTGEFGVVGGLGSAGFELFAQLSLNGFELQCVDWGDVAAAGFIGFFVPRPLQELGRIRKGFGASVAYQTQLVNARSASSAAKIRSRLSRANGEMLGGVGNTTYSVGAKTAVKDIMPPSGSCKKEDPCGGQQ
jgi:RHS repeat-associated protein